MLEIHLHLDQVFPMKYLAFSPVGAVASLLALAMLAVVSGCGQGSGESPPAASLKSPGDQAGDQRRSDAESTVPAGRSKSRQQPARPAPRPEKPPLVRFETTLGSFTVELDPEHAPQTVYSFLRNYVQRDFYDGMVVHHVTPDAYFVAGGFDETLTEKPGRAPIRNEAHNGLKNVRGAVAMLRDPADAHSATSVFLINVGNNAGLDHVNADSHENYGYCVFGKVVEGMDVVDRIVQQPTEKRDGFESIPTPLVVIKKAHQTR